jgi:hypothetical protein
LDSVGLATTATAAALTTGAGLDAAAGGGGGGGAAISTGTAPDSFVDASESLPPVSVQNGAQVS